MMVMPLIAFEPHISGVCSVVGTFVITSSPTNIASTKMMTATSRPSWPDGASAACGTAAAMMADHAFASFSSPSPMGFLTTRGGPGRRV